MNKESIYIKEIELINFESHKHTILKDFSRGFNCIAGKSDVGKSSVLRAIKVASYNEFSDKMVRLGSSFCEIKITTNIGSVYVQRGKGYNKWTVTRNDASAPMEFDKVGRSEVKEACAVLGIKMIKLGDSEIPINIMNQLEPHFFISSVGGEKTSGSSRAEIIDEICGLNGVEELVKAISLDQYRFTREVTIAEERIKELTGKLHSEIDIQTDSQTLEHLDLLQSNITTSKNNHAFVEDLRLAILNEKEKAESFFLQIKALPDHIKAERLIKHTRDVLQTLQSVQVLSSALETYKANGKRIMAGLSAIPNVSKAEPLLVSAKMETETLKRAKDVFVSISSEKVKSLKIKKELAIIPDTTKADTLFISVRSDCLKYEKMKSLFSEVSETHDKAEKTRNDLLQLPSKDIEELMLNTRKSILVFRVITQLKKEVLDCQQKGRTLESEIVKISSVLETAEKNLSDYLGKIDVCPVTKKPIGETCSVYNSGQGVRK